MPFFNSVGKIFGFGHDEDEYNDLEDEEIQPFENREDNPDDSADDSSPADYSYSYSDNEPAPADPQDFPLGQIFDKVIAIFNQALPDFIAQNIDREKQERQIFDALDESVKKYLNDLEMNAERAATKRWQDERTRLLTEIDQQRERNKRKSDTEDTVRKQLLSSERQKRALTERINDLESQVSNFEAEREQFDLEKKSLVAKLSQASFTSGDVDPEFISGATQLLHERIAGLEQKISDLENERELLTIENRGLNNKLRIATIKGGNVDPSAIPNSDNEAKKEAEKAELIQHQKQLDELNDTIQQLTSKIELSEAIAHEAQSIASTAKKDIKERDEMIELLNREISALKSEVHISDDKETVNISTINELQEKNDELTQKIQSLTDELNTANEGLQALELIEEQITKFEDVKRRKDAKIQELSENNNSLLERICDLEEERDSLKLAAQSSPIAPSDAKLREEVDQLKQEIDRLKQENAMLANNDASAFSNVQTIDDSILLEPIDFSNNSNISSIDHSLDDTDWLISTPPQGSSMSYSNSNNSDFGYQAPIQNKPLPDNDDQMSLWSEGEKYPF